MRLFHFINEAYKEVADTEEEIIKILRRDCKKYIKMLQSFSAPSVGNIGNNFAMPFKRGMETGTPRYADFALYSKKTRKIREPKGGMLDVAYAYLYVNEWLTDNGHFSRIKDALIATSRTTSLFGDQFYVFPIKMKGFTYVEAGDFNFGSRQWDIIKLSSIVDDMVLERYSEEQMRREIYKYMEQHANAFVTNKNIREAYIHEYEVWFNCREYYFIDTDYSREVEDIMREI